MSRHYPHSRSLLILLLAIVLLLCLSPRGALHAQPVSALPGNTLPGFFPSKPALLPEAEAFALQADTDGGQQLQLRYTIAPGYYLYREKLAWHWLVQGTAQTADANLPEGSRVFDTTFQRDMEVYREQLDFSLTIPALPGHPPLTLIVDSQGCAEDRLCYPPLRQRLQLESQGQDGYRLVSIDIDDDALAPLDAATAASSAVSATIPPSSGSAFSGLAPAASATEPEAATADAAAAPAASGPLAGGDLDMAQRLSTTQGQFGLQLLSFFGLGLLLSLTPCVLPMLPIVSAMLLSSPAGSLTRRRGLALAAAYVGGMSIIYTAMGILAGATGAALSSWLQMPWLIGLFAVALALLALAQFDVFTFQMPGALQSRLGRIGQGGIANSLPRAGLLGGVSALVIGPCVAAPLAGALLYLSQSGDVAGAGLSLFIMAWGMGLPLLLLGLLAGRWRPRPGPWMEGIRQLTGLLLLGTAWWLAGHLLPGALALAGWAALACFAAVLLGAFEPLERPIRPGPAALKSAGLLLTGVALVWLFGAASGGRDPLAPLAAWQGPAARQDAPLVFQTVRDTAALDAALAASTRPVMLDVYADWCAICHEMERNTLSDAAVQARLHQFTLLRLDVTRASAADRALMKQLRIFGPPAMLFYDADGQAREDARVIGYMGPQDFLKVLDQLR